ncbi:MAG: hypothetical protein V1882_05785 [Candidatus Omnitrophota bacterium]
MKKHLLMVLCLTMFFGCASVSSKVAPNQDVKNLGSVYAVHFAPDKRHLETVIASDLASRGYKVTSGEEQDVPQGTNTLVTYVDHWMWDITNYMLSLDIELRKNSDKSLIASGRSYRPSMQRAEPEVMVRETLDKILK